MLHELLTRNTKDKIIAVNCGLILVSFALLTTKLTGFQKFFKKIILDDYFFGFRLNNLTLFYLTDIAVLLLTIYLLKKKLIIAIIIGGGWALLNLTESIFDLRVYGYDPHMFLEEFLFIIIYAYLLLLFVALLMKPHKSP